MPRRRAAATQMHSGVRRQLAGTLRMRLIDLTPERAAPGGVRAVVPRDRRGGMGRRRGRGAAAVARGSGGVIARGEVHAKGSERGCSVVVVQLAELTPAADLLPGQHRRPAARRIVPADGCVCVLEAAAAPPRRLHPPAAAIERWSVRPTFITRSCYHGDMSRRPSSASVCQPSCWPSPRSGHGIPASLRCGSWRTSAMRVCALRTARTWSAGCSRSCSACPARS